MTLVVLQQLVHEATSSLVLVRLHRELVLLILVQPQEPQAYHVLQALQFLIQPTTMEEGSQSGSWHSIFSRFCLNGEVGYSFLVTCDMRDLWSSALGGGGPSTLKLTIISPRRMTRPSVLFCS